MWVPTAPASALGPTRSLPLPLLSRSWALFRDASGQPGCVEDACAHRACPLSLGVVCGGRLQCAYHGWEYSSTGACEHMPSTPFLPGISVASLPAAEGGGLIWVWAGEGTPDRELPTHVALPRGFTAVATIAVNVPGITPAALIDAIHAGGSGMARNAADAVLPEPTTPPPPPPPPPKRAASSTAGRTRANGSRAAKGAPAAADAGSAPVAAAAARAILSAGGGLGASCTRSAARVGPSRCTLVSTLRLGADVGTNGDENDDNTSDAAASSSSSSSSSASTSAASSSLRQVATVHAVAPGPPGGSRLLFRLGLNFGGELLAAAPGAPRLWAALAHEVAGEQVRRAAARCAAVAAQRVVTARAAKPGS